MPARSVTTSDRDERHAKLETFLLVVPRREPAVRLYGYALVRHLHATLTSRPPRLLPQGYIGPRWIVRVPCVTETEAAALAVAARRLGALPP